jgi:hypothetical protein
MLCVALVWACVARAEAPVLRDPSIPSGEHTVYRLTKHSGTVSTSTHDVRVDRLNNIPVYVVRTNTSRLVLSKSDMTPLVIESLTSSGEVELRLDYSSDRVNFIYPGPRRNRVEKVDANRYDVRSIVYVARALPPTGKLRVELTLVTDEHILGVYFFQSGTERVTVPAGAFDCVVYEAGLTGLKGRLVTKKIRFWVEKVRPYRLVRQEDEGVSDVRLVELLSSTVARGGSTP